MTETEERLKRFTSEMNKKLESQEALSNKTKQERREQALLLVGLQNDRSAEADNQRAVEERDSTILDLRSLLEHRNRELMFWSSPRPPLKMR